MYKFILFFIILILSSCGKVEKEVKNPRGVVYQIIKSEKNSIVRDYSGVITSEAISNLSFRVSGTINNRVARLGDTVKKGDILATLDPAEYKVKYGQALADLNKSRALLVESKGNYKRAQALYLENSISKASYDQAIANFKSSESSVNALMESLKLAKLQLNYTILKAPSDGTIGAVKSEINESVTPSSTVFILNSLGQKYIEFNVSQSVIGDLKINQLVKITINSLNNLKLTGGVSNIGTLSTGFGNTYPVKVKLNNSESNLIKIGMIGNVSLNIKESKKSIIQVPVNCILTDSENNKFVYCVKDIKNKVGVAEKTVIKLGDVTSENVIVKKGLTLGEYIITKGGNHIFQGERVFLLAQGDE